MWDPGVVVPAFGRTQKAPHEFLRAPLDLCALGRNEAVQQKLLLLERLLGRDELLDVGDTDAELAVVEGPRDVFVGARVERAVADLPLVRHRHHDDVGRGPVGVAEAADELDSVHARHTVVDDDQIDGVAERVFEALQRIVEGDHLQLLEAPQDASEDGEIGPVVVDQDYVHACTFVSRQSRAPYL